MPLKLIRDDITKVACDAIVNAANHTLLGGGGVDGAIHRAAGGKLLEECRKLGGCGTGEAKITRGYLLPAKYVIHTVGPVWSGGDRGEEELLRSCYRNSLALAKKKKCGSVAFPLISSGAYGYPKDRALKVAVDEITAFLATDEMTVFLVFFDKASFSLGGRLFDDISAFIDDKYADDMAAEDGGRSAALKELFAARAEESSARGSFCDTAAFRVPAAKQTAPRPGATAKKKTLDEALKTIDESFSEMLMRKIDEKGMKDPECYKKANIDRKLFSKIRSDRSYKPSKTTAIAFAIALELPLSETRDMLMKAGFALSYSSKFDIIVEYFITNGNYDVFEINEALFAFDQPLIGG